MGQKVSPIGLRIGINKGWEANWYASGKDFSNYAVFCMTSTIEKGIFKKELFNKYIDAKFEHLNVMMIEKGDAALRNSYGDYMKLPPVEEQVSHHFVCEIEYEKFNK